jgi:hypothetical protein
MESFFKEYADLSSWLGLFISTAGMLLTIWTLVTAQGIKAKLMRRFQLPPMIKDIQDGLTELGALLSETNVNSQSLKVLISRLSVTLENAHKKTKGEKVAAALMLTKNLLKLDVLVRHHGDKFILEMTGAREELLLENRDDPWNI